MSFIFPGLVNSGWTITHKYQNHTRHFSFSLTVISARSAVEICWATHNFLFETVEDNPSNIRVLYSLYTPHLDTNASKYHAFKSFQFFVCSKFPVCVAFFFSLSWGDDPRSNSSPSSESETKSSWTGLKVFSCLAQLEIRGNIFCSKVSTISWVACESYNNILQKYLLLFMNCSCCIKD